MLHARTKSDQNFSFVICMHYFTVKNCCKLCKSFIAGLNEIKECLCDTPDASPHACAPDQNVQFCA